MFTGTTKGGRGAVKVEDIPWPDEENNIRKSLVLNFRKYNRLPECPEEEQHVNISPINTSQTVRLTERQESPSMQ